MGLRTRLPRGYSGLPLFLVSGLVVSVLSLPGGRSRVGAGERKATPDVSALVAPLATPTTIYVPAAAHAGGANGADWRTDVEVHNPDLQDVSFTVDLLVRDSDNTTPDTRSYTVAALSCRRFTDFLSTEFGFTGAAALRIVPASGRLVVTSRTFLSSRVKFSEEPPAASRSTL